MLGVRVNSFNENSLGEPEQDANSALTELDKGLRSNKVGDQCDAIVRFPRLFEKYPFPILINASLLKLAEVFRTGNNFLRLCVLRVCQQSEKHLDKVSNVDEFVRRVYSVIHSNDPIARALVLRTLGAVACIIPERQQVHHCIRTSLDSHDEVEVEAAIFIAIQFAAHSKTFAIGMCNKISDMIQGQATPANMKLQLIPILQHMHHDTNTAAMVRNLCIELLPTYPAEEFVLTILNTLTQLAAATLVDIPSQVLLLLQYLKTDPRWEVKSHCLKYLHQMAKPGAHLWPNGAVDCILDMALETTSPKMLRLALSVIEVLTKFPKLCHEHQLQSSKLRQLCSKHSVSSYQPIAALSINILTQIVCYCYKENIEVGGTEEIICSLETLILLLTYSEEKYPYQLKLALKCAVKLAEHKRDNCERFIKLLGSRLGFVDGDCTIIICEALGAIGSLDADTLLPLLRDIVQLLVQISAIANPSRQQTTIAVMLCTLVFQTLSGYNWNQEVTDVIHKVTSCNNLWANYRIGRAAVRYGHHAIAFHIFNSLTEQVSSEHWHFWLVCLKEMSEGEVMLASENGSIVGRLDSAVAHYNKAIAALKAASTPSHNLQFQAEYMRIRAEYLQCLLQLLHTCNILCIVPPPAIASTIAQTTRDEFQRHGYITNQMRKCVKDFQACGDLYLKLYQTAFDADPATLENIQILQQMCVLLEQCIDSVCSNNTQNGHTLDIEVKNLRLECRQLLVGCRNAAKIGKSIGDQINTQTITHKHVELLNRIVEVLVDAPLPVPRFFFQVLQCTTLKLAISPQPRVMGEFISVQTGSQLAVKVEGVIQHGQKPGLYRHVEGVVVTVTSQLQPSNKIKDSDIKAVDANSVLTQTVTPHKDFFSAQFLLAFPRGGQYILAVDASVADKAGNTWKTGPRSTLTVKVPEEPKLQPISMPGMAGNSNVILMAEDSHFLRKK
ncbi:PREDICTED: integrator complex subunit 7 [Nicrophorus vespilloides]|uniref:Integrator complex subunit 7 n=1 Tax=Nicrophorus vespilloides TaxID=110193 RepID=A0ABM1N396_NICVS|nr:PREDICTED: integrator complex subunit 7 [Nicrophorus vespilloides]